MITESDSFVLLLSYYTVLPLGGLFFYFVIGVNIESDLPDWWHILSHYLLLFGFHQETMISIMGHAWSIFDEFIFYIVFGLLMIKVDVKSYIYKYIIVLFGISFITFLFNNIFLNDNLDLKGYFFLSPFIQMYVFFMGGGIYLISKKYKIKKYFYYLVVFFLLVYSFFLSSTTLSVYLSTILFSILILYMSQNKLHYNKFFLYLGKISFSFYLIHIFIIAFVTKYFSCDINPIILISVIFILTTVSSMISYTYIEQPFIKIGRKFIDA